MIKLNDKLLTFKQFPNGETIVDGNEIQENMTFFGAENQILFKYETDQDLIQLMLVKKHLDSLSKDGTFLIISYMPYSRMDRVEGDSVFTLRYASDFINMLNFSRVYIHEPHSDVTLATVQRSMALDTTKELFLRTLKKIDFDKEKDYVFFPDAGAQKRYGKIGEYNEMVAFKKRNFETNRIESVKVCGEMVPGQKVVIVDDLCSYGGTAMRCAEELKAMGAGDIYLVVAHTEHTIFEGEIPDSPLITKVFTTDSIIDKSKSDKVDIAMTIGWQEVTEEEKQPEDSK